MPLPLETYCAQNGTEVIKPARDPQQPKTGAEGRFQEGSPGKCSSSSDPLRKETTACRSRTHVLDPEHAIDAHKRQRIRETVRLSPVHRPVAQKMFRMIGQYEITRDGDVIRVWSSSEFNLEAAQQYALDMIEMIKQMPPKFGTLVAFDAPPIIGPEVEASMRRSALQRAERGMVAVAFVTLNLEWIEVASAQWDRIYERSGITFQFFRDVESARTWLQQQIDRCR